MRNNHKARNKKEFTAEHAAGAEKKRNMIVKKKLSRPPLQVGDFRWRCQAALATKKSSIQSAASLPNAKRLEKPQDILPLLSIFYFIFLIPDNFVLICINLWLKFFLSLRSFFSAVSVNSAVNFQPETLNSKLLFSLRGEK